MNKLKIDFLKVEYGWLSFQMSNHKKNFLFVGASYVYNPFNWYVNILDRLAKGSRRKETLIIDREGFDSEITFIPLNNGNIIIRTKTLSNRWYVDKPYQAIFNKKQVIKEMTSKLYNFYLDNEDEINSEIFDFTFNIEKLDKIKV